jgi:hypothetical protein
MSCFHPITAYKKLDGSGIQFHSPYSDVEHGFKIPCRQCSGCRSEYSRQWAMRILHEASLNLHNSYITLTYNDAHLPGLLPDDNGNYDAEGTLKLQDFQKFMKRLRKKYPNKIRFYHCGEYGEKQGRPHYHAILFNHQFNDLIPVPGKKDLYTSKQLLELWGKGHISVGHVTFESAAYVANYVQKKITGKKSQSHYINKHGEPIKPEYSTMSRNPGIARDWFDKYHEDVYPSDFITIKGRKMRPPKYYDSQYEILYPEQLPIIKENRQTEFKKIQHLFTPEALKQKELNHKAKMALYKRNKL